MTTNNPQIQPTIDVNSGTRHPGRERLATAFLSIHQLLFAGLLFIQTILGTRAQTAYVNFEGKQTNPVRLSPDGTRLFAVNTPDARLSVFDVSNPSNPTLIAEIPVGLEPVSVNALSNDEAWVVNEVSDSVSIVSVSRGIVVDTLRSKDEPSDIVFAYGRAFVTCSRNNLIRVFDVATHAELPAIPVFGNNPRALAVGVGGTKIYAAFALSGNRTTLIPAALAPPQPSPVNITNTPPQVGLIVDAADTNWSQVIKYTMPDNDVVEIDAASLTVTRYFPHLGTVNLGLAVNPVSGDLFVANTDARNLIHFEPGVRGHAIDNRITRISTTDGSVTPVDLNPGIDYTLLPNPAALATALAQPTATVCDPAGRFLYVAAFGTDRVARLDTNGAVLARIEIGPATGTAVDPRTKRGPRGLALNSVTQRLYVLNRIANTISVIDTSSDSVVREIPVGSFDPTPAYIHEGRGFLYDAKLSGNGTMSCASCHVDGEMDMLAWDLGDPFGRMESVIVTTFGGDTYTTNRHPMKGPMTTQTLRGLKGLEPLHWRGDRASFLAFNAAFNSLLGGSVLTNVDMTTYRDFVNSIVFQPNPNQNLDRTLPARYDGASPAVGKSSYQNYILDPNFGVSCMTCHKQNAGSDLPVGNGTVRQIMADRRLDAPQHLKVPHLRNLYQKVGFTNQVGAANITGFGFSHDGRDGTLFDIFGAPRFGGLTNNDVSANLVKSNLVALLMCFDTGTAPAVGYSQTVTPSNVNDPAVTNAWSLLENQATLRFQDSFILAGSVTNIQLVARGTVDGERCSLLFQPATSIYVADKTGVGPFTHAQLMERITAGDTLTVLGVPTVSGRRLGIDRNSNGVPDGDEMPPALSATRSVAGIEITWPTNSVGAVLEFTQDLAAQQWKMESGVRSPMADQWSVVLPVATGNRFYRLRGL